MVMYVCLLQPFVAEPETDVAPPSSSLQPTGGTTGSRSASPANGRSSPRPTSAASNTRGHYKKNVVEPLDEQGSMVSIRSKGK